MSEKDAKSNSRLFMESEDGGDHEMIYIASPYTHPDGEVVRARVKAAQAVAADMVNQGKGAFSPVLYTKLLHISDLLDLETRAVLEPDARDRERDGAAERT